VPDIRVVIFHRGECFYPLELPRHEHLGRHAECNPGTTMITDAETGDVLWLATIQIDRPGHVAG
jgi:hypothetical protein